MSNNFNSENNGSVDFKEQQLNEVRYFSLVSYACFHDINIVINDHAAQIEHAEVILHDKDVKEDGTAKINHYHINLWLNHARRNTVIRSWFKHCMDDNYQYANTLVQHTKDCLGAYEYLTHKNHPNKVQYDEKDIIVYGRPIDDYIMQRTLYAIKKQQERSYNASFERCDALIDELIAGAPFRVMVANYGRDFIINYKRYAEMASLCCIDEYNYDKAMRLAIMSGNDNIIRLVNDLYRNEQAFEKANDNVDDIMQYKYEKGIFEEYGYAVGMMHANIQSDENNAIDNTIVNTNI